MIDKETWNVEKIEKLIKYKMSLRYHRKRIF